VALVTGPSSTFRPVPRSSKPRGHSQTPTSPWLPCAIDRVSLQDPKPSCNRAGHWHRAGGRRDALASCMQPRDSHRRTLPKLKSCYTALIQQMALTPAPENAMQHITLEKKRGPPSWFGGPCLAPHRASLFRVETTVPQCEPESSNEPKTEIDGPPITPRRKTLQQHKLQAFIWNTVCGLHSRR
jgi:hypothetical protein